MINIKRLDHFQICIPKGKEEEARAFYTDIIGLKEIPKPLALQENGGLWYELNDIELHIGTENVDCQSKRHPAFEVQHIRLVKQYLQEKEVKIKENTLIPGVERFDFWDPFNNRIEFLEKTIPASEAIEQFWVAFIQQNKKYKGYSRPPHFYFCDNEKDADQCAQLVKEGIKTGTCGALIDYKVDQEPLPEVGDLFIVTDWAANPVAIVQTKQVDIRKFNKIDEKWAKKEGEGDFSLEYWRKGHWAFFERQLANYGLQPNEEMLLVCEAFEVIFT